MRAVGERLAHLIGVERGEVRTAAQLFGAAFFLIATQTDLKVVRDAMFLSRFTINALAYLMLGMAVVTYLALLVYNRASAGRPRNRVIWALNTSVAISLVALGVGLRGDHRHLSVLLYGWVSIVGLLVLTEFWLLADEMFHARQAKRLISVIAAGGVLGGIAGGGLARALPRHYPVADLLFFAAAQLLVAAALCDRVWRRFPDKLRTAPTRAAPPRDFLRIASERPYVRAVALVMLLMTVATTLADWQLKAFAKQHFASQEAAMARFFGILAVVLGLLSFLLQMLGTHRLLRWVGAGGCMRALPTATGIGALAVMSSLLLPFPVVVAAGLGNMLVDGVKFSVDRSATELLYAPFAVETRAVVKRFIETALDRFGGAVAAVVWLLAAWLIRIDWPGRAVWVSMIVLALVAGWLLSVQALRGEYVDAFRTLLGAHHGEWTARASERTRRRVTLALAHLGHDSERRLAALRRLTALQATAPLELDTATVEPHIALELDQLELLLRVDHASRVWGPPRLPILIGMVQVRVHHACERIVRLLATVYPPSDIRALHRALRLRGPRLREAALEFLDALVDLPSKQRLLRLLEQLALADAPEEPALSREEALRALLAVDDAKLRACAVWSAVSLGILLDEARELLRVDPSRTVRVAALFSLSARRKLRADARVAAAARSHANP